MWTESSVGFPAPPPVLISAAKEKHRQKPPRQRMCEGPAFYQRALGRRQFSHTESHRGAQLKSFLPAFQIYFPPECQLKCPFLNCRRQYWSCAALKAGVWETSANSAFKFKFFQLSLLCVVTLFLCFKYRPLKCFQQRFSGSFLSFFFHESCPF